MSSRETRQGIFTDTTLPAVLTSCTCACVAGRDRERERDREGGRGREWERTERKEESFTCL